MTEHKINDRLTLLIEDSYERQPILKYQEWVDELNKPGLKRIPGLLCYYESEADTVYGECCLGVYCRVLGLEKIIDPAASFILDNTSKPARPVRYISANKEIDDEPQVSALPFIKENPEVISKGVVNIVQPGVSVKYTDYYPVVPLTIVYRHGDSKHSKLTLANLNDSGHFSFPEIAKVIELLFKSYDESSTPN